eukprot:3209919-Prymnesium_polylepis.1
MRRAKTARARNGLCTKARACEAAAACVRDGVERERERGGRGGRARVRARARGGHLAIVLVSAVEDDKPDPAHEHVSVDLAPAAREREALLAPP